MQSWLKHHHTKQSLVHISANISGGPFGSAGFTSQNGSLQTKNRPKTLQKQLKHS